MQPRKGIGIYKMVSSPGDVEEALKTLQARIHETAVSKGWWDEERNTGEILCLIHSEVSEALEAYRDPKHDITEIWTELDGNGVVKPEGFTVELADVLIRILDVVQHHELPFTEALLQKMFYNTTRPHKHGGKRA